MYIIYVKYLLNMLVINNLCLLKWVESGRLDVVSRWRETGEKVRWRNENDG